LDSAGKILRDIEELKNLVNLGTPALAQMAIARYLADGSHERHLKKLRGQLERYMKEMRGAVLEHFPEGTRVSEPQGGFVLWVEMPQKVDSLRLYHEMLEHNIILAPGSMFSMNSKFNNYMRLNAGNWNRQIHDLVALIGARVKEMAAAE